MLRSHALPELGMGRSLARFTALSSRHAIAGAVPNPTPIAAAPPAAQTHPARRPPGTPAGAQAFAALLRGRADAALPGNASDPAWQAAPNADFRQRIAEAERSAEHARSGYGLRNASSGALGRYQFLPSTLVDIGWRGADGAWSAAAQRQGVSSDADFLARPAAQEAAMSAYLRRVETQLERNGSAGRQGEVLRGVAGQEITLTEAGLVAAAHRRGAGAVARWLQHRTNTPDAPLSAAQRNVYAQVERRVQDFAAVSYASQRAPAAVTPTTMAAASAATRPRS